MTTPLAPTDGDRPAENSFTVTAPKVELPKGGGAIRGIGEKFAANPVTGTASFTVPIATSPGRSDFGPQLSLSYDSGVGNSPYGFGWSLSVPMITRKTDKGLPTYHDERGSDTFILSGSEDLVRQLNSNGQPWTDTTTAPGYTIYRYRPRIEGLFARVERWTRDDGDTHWRSISRDNILTIYGKDCNSRIAEHTDDPTGPTRVFSWLISEIRDDRGNAIVYDYKTEDGVGAPLGAIHQRNRGGPEADKRKTNRYLKHIRYGNRTSLLDPVTGARPPQLTETQIKEAGWMFQLTLDYGEHDANHPTPDDDGEWAYRADAFSTYRAGFEVRTARLCRRFLMFHHFPGEEDVGENCLVRSTDLTYTHADENGYAFIQSVTQRGYTRNSDGYLTRSMPPVEYEYTQATVRDTVHDVDPDSLRNLPIGLDGTLYQFVDLHGEGIPGILTEQDGTWYYQRNISPISTNPVEFAPIERVGAKPNVMSSAQFLDLAGDGRLDLVDFDGPVPGLYEHDHGDSWKPFRPFISALNRNLRDPNTRFVDLTGDGLPDILITEDAATLIWHPSLGEDGFAAAERVQQALDEEEGPRLVFTDGTDSIHLADMSGDGLVDLVRIRNSEICYWPNLGYGHFGTKITMDHTPVDGRSSCFDYPDLFDPRRLRLADIDGSGTTDIIYLHQDGVRLYFNQSGNGFGKPITLPAFPRVDDLSAVIPLDLHGNGTACLAWSSPLPSDSGRQMRYVDLIGDTKPHLLSKIVNNLGTETEIIYTTSVAHYLQDERDGHSWITRLSFPVHVVDKVVTCDRISGNRFTTSYTYHHGYFDGEEREFRGFARVDQLDTEVIASHTPDEQLASEVTNDNPAFLLPSVLTRTWFHTGAWRHHTCISRQLTDEYFAYEEFEDWLLDDTLPPIPPTADANTAGLTGAEISEGIRALKGAMLRQEVYALDAPGATPENPGAPYTITEQNFIIRCLQRRHDNPHAVFFTHPHEAISHHLERNPADPRTSHTLTLRVDDYGNVLRSATVNYPRNPVLGRLPEQTETHIVLTTARVANHDIAPDWWYRAGLPVETCTYEIVKPPEAKLAERLKWSTLDELTRALIPFDQYYPADNLTVGYRDWDWRARWTPGTEPGGLLVPDHSEHEPDGEPTPVHTRLRLIEHIRTTYRAEDLTTYLPLGAVDCRALPGESYQLALTSDLVTHAYRRKAPGGLDVQLLDPANLNDQQILEGIEGDQGGYRLWDGGWWIRSGRAFYGASADVVSPATTAAQERNAAQMAFYQPVKYTDPFGHSTTITLDNNNLLVAGTLDAAGNSIDIVNDYRVLQPRQITDPNRNRTAVAFDCLGLVVATAVMGKERSEEDPRFKEGDLLEGLNSDPDLSDIQDFVVDPRAQAAKMLGRASTRIAYDIDRYHRCGQPPFSAILARETHFHAPGGDNTKIQVSFSYSDGFGREIQNKIQAEAGETPRRDAPDTLPTNDIRPGELIRDQDGTLMDPAPVTRRWVGSGRTVFNNKGKPVRQYEPFFSATHLYEPEQDMTDTGVSAVLFYDPAERVIATLHPNHTYEKAVFDPWQQTTYDVNDTCAPRNDQTGDPRTDPDICDYLAAYFKTQSAGWQTWHARRVAGALGQQEKDAAIRAAAHADTPITSHFDALGRPLLTVARNRVVCSGHDLEGTEDSFATRVELDIEGNQREVRDAVQQAGDQLGRIVMRYAYDMLGNRIHQLSMEAGARWMLNDATGKPIRAWDSRGHNFTTSYDALRRPIEQQVHGTHASGAAASDPRTLNRGILVDKIEYGESVANAKALNLRTRIYRHSDSAGITTNARLDTNGTPLEAYDFKGNSLHTTRHLVSDYKEIPDWSSNPRLEDETFEASTRYDALNRPIQSIAPHSNRVGTTRNIIQPVFNEANLLERVHVWLEHDTEPPDLLDPATETPSPVGVTNIDYNAKGQRARIDYKNGASTRYQYDPGTFRLAHLYTRRGPTFTDDCDNPQPPPPESISVPDTPPSGVRCGLQNLHYTYDPAGNITHIRDDAQQKIFFSNTLVEPSNDYTYDALYRLIHATGREHLGQTGGVRNPPTAPDGFNAFHTRLDHPGDFKNMGIYCEYYVYDSVGNFKAMKHHGSDPEHAGWTRQYDYYKTSLIENGHDGTLFKTNNQLTQTTLNPSGAKPLQTEHYQYDAHGNMIQMPHLGDGSPDPNMHWDYKDQLQHVDRGGGGEVSYIYDSSGQRVRKVWEKSPGLTEERIYLAGYEIFRSHAGSIGENTATLEREMIHIMDDTQRVALVETRIRDTAEKDLAPRQLIRFQFDNHLGSASLELDDSAQIISYEEYSPYGSSTYQAARSQTETPNRYRYIGRERDSESGLNYHVARYYAPWLGRWTSTDPIGLSDGPNLYIYAGGNPIMSNDPGGRTTKSIRVESNIEIFKKGGKPVRSHDVSTIDVEMPSTEVPKDANAEGQVKPPPREVECRPLLQRPQFKENEGPEFRQWNPTPDQIYDMELSRDDRRAEVLARAHPAFASTIHGKQREEFFLKAAPFLIPGAPEARLAGMEEAAVVNATSSELAVQSVTRAEELAKGFYSVTTPRIQAKLSHPRQPVTISAVTRDGTTVINVNEPSVYRAFLQATEEGTVALRPGEFVGSPPIPSGAVPHPEWESRFLHSETQGERELAAIFDLRGSGTASSFPNPGCYLCVPWLEGRGIAHVNPKR
ncbi:SpvB/TcaC N-terminal domain-containing protein [Rhodococcus aetherivorans]|uniref:SpvB/TcaC N-terminal domain-containing protein n=1 Tax=Rhodococcus aetherivorans TaxID=191292 RepID=UPI0036A680B2